jgi:N-carbamoylputrescine amidase
MTTLKVGWVQHACGIDKTANLAKSTAGVREAAGRGAQLVVLQELHATRYFCQTEDLAQFDLAEPIPGPSTEALAAAARDSGAVVVGSLFERRAPGLFHNTAVVFDADGSLAGTYRKMHIPDDPGYFEKYYFTPGDLGFEPVETSIGRVGVLVCWDQWFPEAARLMALAGADVLVYPTAIGWDPRDDAAEQARQRDAWITIQRSHAIANGVPVVAVNRTGAEPDPSGQTPGSQFWGSSFVADSFGAVVGLAPTDTEDVGVIAIDLARREMDRRVWPFFRDRRIDAYGDLLRRYRN